MPDADRVVSERFGVVLVAAAAVATEAAEDDFGSAECDLTRVNLGSDALLCVGCDLELEGAADVD